MKILKILFRTNLFFFQRSNALAPAVLSLLINSLKHSNDLNTPTDHLNNLTVEELVKLAYDSPRYKNIILNQYLIKKFRLHEKKFELYKSDLLPPRPLWVLYSGYHDGYKNYIIKGFNEILQMIGLFGHIFSHLHYKVFGFEDADWQQIFKFGEKYCSKATKKITVSADEIEAATNLSHVFDSTMTKIDIFNADSDRIPLNELFPYMEELKLLSANSPKVIGQHFPHLKKCSIETIFHDNHNEQEFIRLNPQLRGYHTLIYNNASYVRYLNEMLPNLQILSLKVLVNSDNIADLEYTRFKNVKEFTLDLSISMERVRLRPIIGNITFEQLKTFNLQNSRGVYNNELHQMIIENDNLSKVFIDMRITQEQIFQIIEALPKLEELSLFWRRKSSGISTALEALLSGTQKHAIKRINIHNYFDDIENFKRITRMPWEINEERLEFDRIISFSRLD